MDFLFAIYAVAILFSFFVVGAVIGAVVSSRIREKLSEVLHVDLTFLERRRLNRSEANPLLRPGHSPWTAEAVLNPAALVLGNRVHLIYRAVGNDGVSRLGYTSSADGIAFDVKLSYPAFIARSPRHLSRHLRIYSPVMYPSGGSWGGCEDPRMVLIEGRVYVTYNMFDGWNFIRVAVISIDKDDFLAGRFWKWDGPHILSPAGQIHKNWILFPEKIGGKFALLHSLFGETDDRVRIEYIDDLESFVPPKGFVSADPHRMPDNNIAWHYRMRSAGPPPVKTDRGWLLFYHAMDRREPHRYKMGVMLLDLADPTKILYRSPGPVLEPDASYENEGKPGIVYACGAVIRDGEIYVYYGGGDRVICLATAPLTDFLDALVHGETLPLK